MRKLAHLVLIAAAGCGSHPPEGDVVLSGHGVQGLPGGAQGVQASHAVPISGGTLLIARNGNTAVAADPDRDRVWIVDLAGSLVVREIALDTGDEPGRAAEDGNGRVHVALRRGGALVGIDLATGDVLSRRAVCPAPRGVAWDEARDAVVVACDTGELVTLPAAGGKALSRFDLGRDLRDVVVQNGHVYVTRFRSAEVLEVDADGSIVRRVVPASRVDEFSGTVATPSVAWRTVSSPTGGLLMVHERASGATVPISPGGYGSSGGGCTGSIVEETVSPVDPQAPDDPFGGGPKPAPPIQFVAGAADLAVSSTGRVAVVFPGNSWPAPPQTTQDGVDIGMGMPQPKLIVLPPKVDPSNPCAPAEDQGAVQGEPTAVAFDGQGRIVVQSREPAQLQVMDGAIIRLSDESRADSGLALFHRTTGAGIACASCHPEGREDGRTWSFDSIGPRRTQAISGGVAETPPFHWNGDMTDFAMLVHEVQVSRMGGERPNAPQIATFAGWVDGIEPPEGHVADSDAVTRGQALFDSSAVGCTECHSGAQHSDGLSHDVGTGGTFQTPRLIGVGARAPFLHAGCAATLKDRFGNCGGGDEHGSTSQLAAGQVDDLVAYLESL